ncbi:MAG: hypothetical protein WA172_08670 [Terriglobales bacterium]
MKTLFLAMMLLGLAGVAAAQTAPAKKAPTGPTKVAGAPIKTPSGLEYWDIKVGTGAVAQTGHEVKVDYTAGSRMEKSSIARWARVVRSNSCSAPVR